ncbi:toxin-antitoxin system HicB family antitoxin [bacterium]|nr:toxin-antitoxin system HicB family antitoxin [bacterium]MBR2651791.1 toxin-antitoxin system HicB family antitoxin [bacterium]
MTANKKQFPIRIETELYKKLKIKATANDSSVNEYVISLISADVDDVDLSGLINE